MMLHTQFQGHWAIGSGEEDFLRFLPYMGMAAMSDGRTDDGDCLRLRCAKKA